MRSRVFVARLILLVVSTTGVVVAVEIALRIHAWSTDPARADDSERLEASRRAEVPTRAETASLLGLVQPSSHPSIIYELNPNLAGSFLQRPVRTNAHGMRDRGFRFEKPPGTHRVVGLGDSVMFGWGVAAEESYMGILADELQTRQSAVEVLNFAVPGYNTVMEVATFRAKALAFDPDVVLLHVIRNDMDLPRFLLQPRRVWGFDRWYLVDLIRGAAPRGMEGYWLEPHDLEGLSHEDRQRVDERYRFLVGEEAFKGALADLASDCRPRGIEVLVIVPSCQGEMWSVVCGAARELGFSVLELGPHLGRYLAENNLPNNRETWIRTFWLSHSDPHPNPLSHEIYGEAILDWLDTRL